MLDHKFQWKWPSSNSWLLVEDIVPKCNTCMPSNWALEGQLNLNKPTNIFLFISKYCNFFLKYQCIFHDSYEGIVHNSKSPMCIEWPCIISIVNLPLHDGDLTRYYVGCLKTSSFSNANVKLWQNNRWRFWI
jgi:hypothetical protein